MNEITDSLNSLGWLNSCNRKSDWLTETPSTGSWVTRDTSGTIISLPANSPFNHPYQVLQNTVFQWALPYSIHQIISIIQSYVHNIYYYSSYQNINIIDVTLQMLDSISFNSKHHVTCNWFCYHYYKTKKSVLWNKRKTKDMEHYVE